MIGPGIAITVTVLAAGGEALRVDISPDNGRGDVISSRYQNWRIDETDEANSTFGSLTITIRPAGAPGSRLTTGWWKAGFDTGAVLVSDGVTVQGGNHGGQIELVIRGLIPGRHSLATWHNTWEASGLSPFRVLVDGRPSMTDVRPSIRAVHDDDAATAFVEFEAVAGRPVVITFVPDGTGPIDNVVLNGFAIDVPDPARQARRPSPSDDDEHVAEEPVLRWAPAPGAGPHRVFLGTDREAIAAATTASAVFRGTTNLPEWSTSSSDPFTTYYWRVDEVDRDHPEHVTPGRVWRFRIRRLAFPGAEGYGRFAAGGRGGRVIEVTNLNDAGPGSLREAVEADGPRTVVFRLGGTIRLASKLVIRNPYLTIAGQTAPGDGICIRGYTFGCLGTHDVVIRHVRIRVGDEAHLTMDGTGFASTDHAFMDHCSISWSIDEAVSSRGAGNITVQRCMISEALNIADHAKYKPGTGHSFAGSVSGNVGSFHHNLLAHCAGRNWSLAGGLTRGGQYAGYLDIRNNVVFNWQHRTTDGGVKALNFVNNYYIPGPATKVFHLVKPDAGSAEDPQQYFIAGNRMEGRPQYDADNWANGGVVIDPDLVSRIKLASPFCEPFVTTQAADEACTNVLSDVGANWPKYDAVDERVLHDVRQRTFTYKGSCGGLPGIIDSQSDVGGWPDLRSGEPPIDTDHDGMPDDWEREQGLNPHDPRDGARIADSTGYTHLERYLNNLTTRQSQQ